MALTFPNLLNTNFYLFKRLFSSDLSHKTAAIIIIGEEILKGYVKDTNSFFMAKTFHELGIDLRKVMIVGDKIEDVAPTVKEFASTFDYVVTSGGIGPTHDDITYEAVAKAFNEDVYENPVISDICHKFYKSNNKLQELSDGLKLAKIPRSAKLTFGVDSTTGEKLRFPNVSIENVYMFPGVPQFLEKSFRVLSKMLFHSKGKFYMKTIKLNVPEYCIVSSLNKVVMEYPNVMFGSYPDVINENIKVRITIESTCQEDTEKAYNRLKNLIPKDNVVNNE